MNRFLGVCRLNEGIQISAGDENHRSLSPFAAMVAIGNLQYSTRVAITLPIIKSKTDSIESFSFLFPQQSETLEHKIF